MRYSNTGTWEALLDSGSGNAKGLPFVIEGAATAAGTAIPTLDGRGAMVFAALLAAVSIAILRRRLV